MTDSTDHALYYSDDLLANLQLRYGEGMLSPGSAKELANLLAGADLAGQRGLDLGCGLGGYDMLPVAAHGATHVSGVDINGAVIAVAERRAAERGLADRLAFRTVEPGPLPFPQTSFDFVLTKDAVVDIPDKAPVLAELYRVLRSGGTLFLSDWFRADAPYTPEMAAWATTGDETYEMGSLRSTAEALAEHGFTSIETVDRSAWFRAFCRDERDRLAGLLQGVYAQRFGEAQARRSVANAETRLQLAEQGQLLTGHIRARRPAPD